MAGRAGVGRYPGACALRRVGAGGAGVLPVQGLFFHGVYPGWRA